MTAFIISKIIIAIKTTLSMIISTVPLTRVVDPGWDGRIRIRLHDERCGSELENDMDPDLGFFEVRIRIWIQQKHLENFQLQFWFNDFGSRVSSEITDPDPGFRNNTRIQIQAFWKYEWGEYTQISPDPDPQLWLYFWLVHP